MNCSDKALQEGRIPVGMSARLAGCGARKKLKPQPGQVCSDMERREMVCRFMLFPD